MNSYGILTFCLFLVGGMADYPTIYPSPLTPPFYPGQWIYNESLHINLLCYRSSGYAVKWKDVKHDPNPVIESASAFTTKNERANPIQLNITFDKNQFVPRVHVTCYSPRDQKSTTVLIDQWYRTSHVVINNGVRKITVTPSKNSPAVTLKCTADGNPSPTYGYWFNKTESGHVTQLSTASRPLTFIFKNDTEFLYQCQAKNTINKNPWVTSPWVKVSGFDVMKPSYVLLVSSVLFLLSNRL